MRTVLAWLAHYEFHVCLALGWLLVALSMTIFSSVQMVLALAGSVLVARAIKRGPRMYLFLTILGLIGNNICSQWLAEVLRAFGGYSLVVSHGMAFLYSLRNVIVALLILLFGRYFQTTVLGRWQLAVPVAAVLPQLIIPDVFHWSVAMPFINWQAFAAYAELVGLQALALPLVFLASMAEEVYEKWRIGDSKGVRVYLVSLLCLLAALQIGGMLLNARVQREIENARYISVAAVQGNVIRQQKNNRRYYLSNLDRYRELSAQIGEVDLIIWPETVVTSPIPLDLKNLSNTQHDPAPGVSKPLLFGAVVDNGNIATPGFYNAAVLRNPSGRIAARYFKQRLMPFGEYIPLVRYFPVLARKLKVTAKLSASPSEQAIELSTSSAEVRIGAMICYEDLLSGIAANRVTKQDANILIVLSNDGWFDGTIAPLQHHLLASWRAIETRRMLIRATNTGLTAGVSPFGESLAALPLMDSDILTQKAVLLERKTLFSRAGELPVNAFLVFLCVSGLLLSKERNLPGDTKE
jgi:apolipoprotein N-acyltransferase